MRLLAWAVMVGAAALSVWVLLAAAGTVKTLSRADLAVMEIHLSREGHQVRIESGSLVQADGEVVALLNLRPKGSHGGPVAVRYRLGPLDNRKVLSGDFREQQP